MINLGYNIYMPDYAVEKKGIKQLMNQAFTL